MIFTEAEMPDGELTVSDNPNCDVVQLEDADGGAVVALRDIEKGEWFSIAPCTDTEEEEEEEEEEED
eukprot:SAG31_NODE_413_length_15971_cov_7.706842_4_plen_67_part_00